MLVIFEGVSWRARIARDCSFLGGAVLFYSSPVSSTWFDIPAHGYFSDSVHRNAKCNGLFVGPYCWLRMMRQNVCKPLDRAKCGLPLLTIENQKNGSRNLERMPPFLVCMNFFNDIEIVLSPEYRPNHGNAFDDRSKWNCTNSSKRVEY